MSDKKTIPKYRRLGDQELKGLEKELIQFLVVNGIDGITWEKLNISDPDLAEDLINQFSDLIFTKIWENNPYIIYLNSTFAHLVKLERSCIHAIWIKSSNKYDVSEFLSNPKNSKDFEIYKGVKKIDDSEKILIEFLDLGYKLDLNGNFYNRLKNFLKC